MEVEELPDVIWVADPRIDQNINGFKQTIGLYTSVEPTGGKCTKYIRSTSEREAGDPKEVRKFLLHHRLKYTLHGEDGLPLLDRLTPDGVMNTSLGWEEVDLLTEALFEHFDIRRRGRDD